MSISLATIITVIIAITITDVIVLIIYNHILIVNLSITIESVKNH